MRLKDGIEAHRAPLCLRPRRWAHSGVPLEPFSLRHERDAGYFDEEGFFVAYATDEPEDAWLASLPQGAPVLAAHCHSRQAACPAPEALVLLHCVSSCARGGLPCFRVPGGGCMMGCR
jgi:hypothetical protein